MSPDDPLNWSRPWKYLVVVVMFIFTFVPVMSALSLAPMFPLLAAEFKISGTPLALLTGACVLALGYANFIIVPCSNIFGRRVTSIVFTVLAVATTAWEGAAQSHKSFLAARIVNGIATATSESIMVQVVADTFFIHERGLWTGVYFTSYFMGLFLGPVISGTAAARYGWRTFFWICTALQGLVLILLVVAYPETRFDRISAREATDAVAKTASASQSDEKEVAEQAYIQQLKRDVQHVERGAPTPPSIEEPALAPVSRGRPSRQAWKPWQPISPRWRAELLHDLVSPWTKFFNPIIFWAGLMVAGPANLLLLWNLTESDLLVAPPYNFTTSQVGYANFAFVVGGFVGLLTAGPFSDWVAKRASIRNNYIREAEGRLPALIPFCVLTAVGIIVGGLGYDRLWSWPIILVVAYGTTGLAVTSVPTIAIAYAVDCYTPIAGDIMVVATVLKNTCGFAMSYWVFSLAARRGMIAAAGVQFALTVGPMVLAIPLYIWGKSLRRRTRHSTWHTRGV